MKKLLAISVTFLLSCQTENIEGVWIGQYNSLNINGTKSYHSLNTLIVFDKKEFTNYVLGQKHKKQSFEFIRKGNKIVPLSPSHPGFNIESFSEDSLVLSNPQMEEFNLVYRRYNGNFENKSINISGKRYENKALQNTYVFEADSTLLVNSKMGGYWKLKSIHSIDVLELIFSDSTEFMIIDSVKSKKIFLTKYSRKLNKMILTEY
ncbi:hypothetical protein ACEZ3G_12225 [Maribacter algicola]|uniref:Uncharacterized protein n=1 Tax=Meishania litoralis TaxID=3434685 RepID=A0ACC7LKY5_9FLAO